MRSNLMGAAIIAASMLLWVGPTFAHAGLSAKTRCENAKLRAASTYTSCLLRAITKANTHAGTLSQDQIAQCDGRFDRAFQRAQAGGACHTPGGASTLREPIKAHVLRTVDRLSDVSNCTESLSDNTAVCVFSNVTTAIDLGALVSKLSGFGVTSSTPFWIQAWGGDGGNGNVCCNTGGPGGKGGYAQITTTLNAFEAQFNGQQDIYYYLGYNGTSGSNAGGDGGTSTLVTVNDLSESQTSVTTKDTLLFAGGGGGGGAGRGKQVCDSDTNYIYGEPGGDGAAAIAQAVSIIVPGEDGSNSYDTGRSGQGGQVNQGGTEGFGFGTDTSGNGGDPTAPLGGDGGMHTDPQVGFANAPLLQLSGAGGKGQGASPYDAGGGGGGGGYTGGGAGVRAFGDSCVSGAGGGGSSYAQAVPNSPTCAAAPTQRPSNPAGDQGSVQITFALGGCQQ